MSTLTITVDRTGMAGAPDPLVLLGHDGSSNTVLSVTNFQEPAKAPRVRYAPPSDFSHGDVPLGWSWQQSLLSFDVAPFDADEGAGRAAIEELEGALSRLSFEVTVEVNDAPARTYVCTVGAVMPNGPRTFVDMRDSDPVWTVTIPCHPVPTIGV